MKVLEEGLASDEAAHKRAGELGLTGYIVSGPKADGTYQIKVLTGSPYGEVADPFSVDPTPNDYMTAQVWQSAKDQGADIWTMLSDEQREQINKRLDWVDNHRARTEAELNGTMDRGDTDG